MIKSIMPYVARLVSSNKVKTAKHLLGSLNRKINNNSPTLEVFLRIDDPYSYLLLQVIGNIKQRFNVVIQFHVVLELQDEMFPALDMWREYAVTDAGLLAQLYQLQFPQVLNDDVLANRDKLEQATGYLLSIENEDNFAKLALSAYQAVWCDVNQESINIDNHVINAELSISSPEVVKKLVANQFLLASKGHYLGAMIYFEHEWYWGIDRLDHLERRLHHQQLNIISKSEQQAVQFDLTYRNFCTLPLPKSDNSQTHSQVNKKALTIYWSARSPYSYIGLERAVQLADRYQITLHIKPVLPMMMRGMNVPATKKMYIFLDTKREAEKLGLPYGFVADPLGEAVERCYALLDYATKKNKRQAFLLSFARGVNTQGIRAETDKGLATIVTRCGLSWQTAKVALNEQLYQKSAQQPWREEVSNNLDEMYALGCWGVPSFDYRSEKQNVQVWGQDRLGIIEKMIRNE